MGARQKLNQFHVIGSLVVATVFGAIAESTTVFFVVAAALIGAAFYVGDIRSNTRWK